MSQMTQVISELIRQVNYLTQEVGMMQDKEDQERALRAKHTPLQKVYDKYLFTKDMVTDATQEIVTS